MNNLKFRAWNPKTKEMLNGENVLVDGEGDTAQDTGMHTHRLDFCELKICLLTGVEDSHGAELHTGDLVDVEGSGICEVAMCKFYGTILIDSDGARVAIVVCMDDNDKITLVGNKWQNPELIKQAA